MPCADEVKKLKVKQVDASFSAHVPPVPSMVTDVGELKCSLLPQLQRAKPTENGALWD
jgi:hypothetical protein